MLIALLIGEALGLLLLAFRFSRRCRTRLAGDLAWLLAAIATYLVGHALAMGGGGPECIERLLMLKYVGVCFMPPLVGFVFANLSGYDRRLTPAARATLMAAAVLLALLNATNRYHGWFHGGIRSEACGGIFVHQLVPRIGYLVHKAWLMGTMVGGAVACLVTWREAGLLHRRQMVLLWAALAIPFATNTLYHAGIRPFGILDMSPFAIAPMAGLLAWSVARDRLARVIPIARSVLIEQLDDGVLVTDENRMVLDTNPAAQHLLGCDRSCHGHPLADVLRARPAFLERCLREDGGDWEATLDETEQRWALTWKTLHSGRGRRQGFILLIKNITTLRRREEALRESEARLRLLLEHATDLLWNLDGAGIFSYVSPAWRRVTGYSPEQIVGTSFRPLIHPDDLPACEVYLQGMIRERQARTSPEYRVRHADGTWHWHAANAMPVVDDDGRFISMVGVSRDIGAQKQTEEDRERLLRERTDAWREATAAALDAGEAEAARIGRELHDTVCQDLIGIARLSGSIMDGGVHTAGDPNSAMVLDGLGRIARESAAVAGHVRDLSHLLAAPMAPDIPLDEALNGHLSQLERLYGIACELSIDDRLAGWPSTASIHIIRVVREAVVNAARHAGARSVWVDGVVQGETAIISISSDGGTVTDPTLWRPGLGVQQMRMRAALLGGSLDFRQAGCGVVVELALPFTDENGERS